MAPFSLASTPANLPKTKECKPLPTFKLWQSRLQIHMVWDWHQVIVTATTTSFFQGPPVVYMTKGLRTTADTNCFIFGLCKPHLHNTKTDPLCRWTLGIRFAKQWHIYLFHNNCSFSSSYLPHCNCLGGSPFLNLKSLNNLEIKIKTQIHNENEMR